jgi:hypothetical protein
MLGQVHGLLQGLTGSGIGGAGAFTSPVRGGGGGALPFPALAASSSETIMPLPIPPPPEVLRFVTTLLKTAIASEPPQQFNGANKNRDLHGQIKYCDRAVVDIMDFVKQVLRGHGAARLSYIDVYNPACGVS